MDKAEATGFGVAVAGHLALLAALSLGFAAATHPPILNQPMEVSFVDDIGLQSAVPEPTVEPPAQSVAPEFGPPEEAAPQPAEPVPTAKPVPPQPKAVPQPEATQKPSVKPAPAKAAPVKDQAKTAERSGSGTAEKARGARLGKDFLKGLGADPTPSRSQKPAGAVMSAQAMAGIVAAIQRQIQPCANRQVNPGPGASRITVKLNLRLNPDGSLGARPRVVSTNGVDDENSRYEKRVEDLAIAAFTGCSPLRGLPDELYATPQGGWSNFNMNYKLPG